MVELLVKFIGKYLTKPLCVLILVLSVSVAMFIQHRRVYNLNQELFDTKLSLELQKRFYDDLSNNYIEIVAKQEEAINQYKIDLEKYVRKVSEKERELRTNMSEKQKEVIIEVYKNSTSENQLNLVTNILREFSSESN